MSKLPPIPRRYYDEELWREYQERGFKQMRDFYLDPNDRIALDREDDDWWQPTERETGER